MWKKEYLFHWYKILLPLNSCQYLMLFCKRIWTIQPFWSEKSIHYIVVTNFGLLCRLFKSYILIQLIESKGSHWLWKIGNASSLKKVSVYTKRFIYARNTLKRVVFEGWSPSPVPCHDILKCKEELLVSSVKDCQEVPGLPPLTIPDQDQAHH